MHQPMIIWADKQIGYRLYNAPMMIWQHNKMDILSNRKALLIPGRLEKTVSPPPETAFHAKLCQMGLETKSHDPSATNQHFCYPYNSKHQLRQIKCATRSTQQITD